MQGRGAGARWGALVAATAVTAGGVALAVPAEAAAAAGGAIVTTGTETSNAWVDDESNATITASGTTTSITVTGDQAAAASDSEVRFTASGGNAVLPTSGQHAVSPGGSFSVVVGDGTGTCSVSGLVTVRELTFDGGGAPAAVALDWAGNCDGQRSGQVRYASAVPYGGIDVVEQHQWSSPYVGESNAPYDVVVTGHGTQTPAIDTVAIASAAEEDGFVLTSGRDSCTGTTLGDLETCRVTVAATPRGTTPATVTEHLVIGTADGASSGTALTSSTPRVSERGQYVAREGRVMDTRSGVGVRRGAVGARSTVTLKVAGASGVPATGVGSVVLNVTATGATGSSFVSVYPGGTTRPSVSSLNLTRGFTGANLVTVPVGPAGTVSFYNEAGSVQLIADLVGWYAKDVAIASTGTDFFPAVPERVFDSRSDWGERLGPDEYFPVSVSFPGYDARITGFVVNLTATGPTGSGFLSAVPTEPVAAPNTSSLNYTAGSTVPNLVTVRAPRQTVDGGIYPTFWIANSGSASTHVIVDVVGFYGTFSEADPGLRFRSLTPQRVLDTRSDTGAPSVGTAVATRVQAPASVAGWDTWALAGNLTGIRPTAATWLTVWDAGPRPPVSNLNLARGATRPNAVVTGVSDTNGYQVFNAAGTTETLYDVSGSFEAWPASLATLGGYPWPPAAGAAGTSTPDRTAAVRDTARDRVPVRADGSLIQRPEPRRR
ncbi:MAG: hypothetical protein ACRCY8_02330 [Dermatophilaceae bacterium]